MSRSTCSTGLNAPKDFWWQWPCTSGLVGDGAERQLQPAGLGLAHQEFLEGSACAPTALASSSLRSEASSSRRVKRQLGSSPTIGTPRAAKGASGDHAVELDRGFVDEAGGQEGAAAAQRTAAACGFRQMHPIPARREHAQRGVEVSRS